MNRKIILLSLFFVFITILISCKKAGLGGDATIAAFSKHHEKEIYGATIYVKFNTKDSPGSGTSGYDATFVGDAYEDHVHIEGLKQGNYYFYSVGYDSAISAPVYGGRTVTIKRKDKSEEQSVDISVTE